MLIPLDSAQPGRLMPPRVRGARPPMLRAHTDYPHYRRGGLVHDDWYDDEFPRHGRRGFRGYGNGSMEPYYNEYF